MKLVIAGPRDYDPSPQQFQNLLVEVKRWTKKSYSKILVGNNPSGVDKYVLDWAKQNAPEAPYELFKANWKKHGSAAGPIRNRLMMEQGDVLAAFWGGRKLKNPELSDGTLNIILKALNTGKMVVMFDTTTTNIRVYERMLNKGHLFVEQETRIRQGSTLTKFF